jgi:hypothetical protein
VGQHLLTALQLLPVSEEESMPPQLGQFLNKTILVSIPDIFKDDRSRPYTLVGIELSGLWLQGGDLATRLLPEGHKHHEQFVLTAFVPFSQIAAVFVATARPASTPGSPPSEDQKEPRERTNQEAQKEKHSAVQNAENRKKKRK